MSSRFEYVADILLFIGLVIVSYCLFLLYKEINNIRDEVSNIRSDLESQPLSVKNFAPLPSNPIDIPNSLFSIQAQSDSEDEYEKEKAYFGSESDNCSTSETNVITEIPDEEILIIKEKETVLCTEILQKGKRKGEECGIKNCKKHLNLLDTEVHEIN